MEALEAYAEGDLSDLQRIARATKRSLQQVREDAVLLHRFRSTEQFTRGLCAKGEGWWYNSKTPTADGLPGLPFAPFQKRGADTFDNLSIEKASELWPRGHAKTTVLGKCGDMRQTLYNESRYKVIFAYSSKNKRGIMASHKLMLTNPGFFPELHYLLPYFFLGADRDRYITEYNKQDGVMVLAGGQRIEYLSMEGENRGAQAEEGRPDSISLDDIIPSTARTSEADRQRVTDTFFSVIRLMGSADCIFRARGTTMHKSDLLSMIADGTISGWTVNRYRAHKAIDDYSDVLWPDRWTGGALKELYQEYADAGLLHLYAPELLNDPSTAESYPFGNVEFQYGDKTADPLGMYRVMWIDHASGTGGDDFAIVESGEDDSGAMHWLDIYAANVISETQKLTEVASRIQRRRPHTLGCSWNSESIAFIRNLETHLRAKGLHIRIETPREVEAKNDRIVSYLQPRYSAGLVRHRLGVTWQAPLESQLRNFDRSKKSNRDDILDCMARCGEYSRTPKPADKRQQRPADPLGAKLFDAMHSKGQGKQAKYKGFAKPL